MTCKYGTVGYVVKAAIIVLSIPAYVWILVAFMILTIIAIVLLAPMAWATGCSMTNYWKQTNIAFWTGDWMDR